MIHFLPFPPSGENRREIMSSYGEISKAITSLNTQTERSINKSDKVITCGSEINGRRGEFMDESRLECGLKA